MGKEKSLAIKQEVIKLIDVNFVRDIRFQTWMANQILVKR